MTAPTTGTPTRALSRAHPSMLFAGESAKLMVHEALGHLDALAAAVEEVDRTPFPMPEGMRRSCLARPRRNNASSGQPNTTSGASVWLYAPAGQTSQGAARRSSSGISQTSLRSTSESGRHVHSRITILSPCRSELTCSSVREALCASSDRHQGVPGSGFMSSNPL
jgi:hypothetical protein